MDLATADGPLVLARLERLVKIERRCAAAILEHIVAVEDRRLHLEAGYSSLFDYCTRRLGYSEDAAAKRIHAARASRSCPRVLELLKERKIHMSAACILAPHIKGPDAVALLESAVGKSKREVEFIAAGLAPKNAPRDTVGPLTEASVRIAFSASKAVLEKLERARGLLRHKHPDGRLESVVEEALEALLDRIDRGRKETPAPRPPAAERTRHVPEWVKTEVWKRDGGRCAFATLDGKRCDAVEWLEFDHLTPYALGGVSDDPDNIRLLCRAHNQQRARGVFGEWEAA